MSDNQAFVDSLQAATLQIIQETAGRMNKACLIVESEAKRNCPIDQGILRASITSETDITESEIIGRIGSNLFYAPYAHNGTGIYAKDGNGRKTPWGYEAAAGKYKGFHWTHGQRPRPFLENATKSKLYEISNALGGR